MTVWTRPSVVAIILAIVVLGVYAPALALPLLGDDLGIIHYVDILAGQGALSQQVLDDFTSTIFEFNGNYYRPFVTLSFAVDYLLWGVNAFGYHLTNLLLHLANTLLLYAITLRLLPPALKQYRTAAAMLAALFFALRPATPEVALWVSGRGDSLAVLGALVMVYAYLRAQGQWNRWYLLSLAGFLFALGSKEPAATLPAALVGLHLFGFVAPRATVRESMLAAMRALAPFVLLLGGYFLLRWTLFGSPTYVQAVPPIELTSSAWLTPKIASLRYFTVPRLVSGWDNTLVNLTMLFFLATGALLCFASKLARRLWGVGWLWVASILVPALPQFYVNGLEEGQRLMYLPTAPLALVMIVGVVALGETASRRAGLRKALGALATAALLVVLLVTTPWLMARIREWEQVGAQYHTIMSAVRSEAATVPAGYTRLLMIPGTLEGVFLGRNGQGSFMEPPFQPESLLGPVYIVAPEIPCQPQTNLPSLALYDTECWNPARQQFEPFDPAAYDPDGYPQFWRLP